MSWRSRALAAILLMAAFASMAHVTRTLVLSNLHSNDFRHLYLGMKALLDGTEPYSASSLLLQAKLNGMADANLNPYVYLPFTGLSVSFLSLFPFHTATRIWLGLNYLFAVASCWFAASALFPRNRLNAFALSLLVLSWCHPFVKTLTAGQLNVALLLCLTAAYALLARGKDKLAGIVLGFAACFKIAPAIFVLVFLLRRRWQALTAMACASAAFMLISLLLVGWKTHMDFIPMLRQMSYGKSTWSEWGATFWKDPPNQSINSLMSHLVAGMNGITPWAHLGQGAANGITIAASVVLLGTYVWLAKEHTDRTRTGTDATRNGETAVSGGGLSIIDQASYHGGILLMLLLPSLMWDHYLIMALFPAAWLISIGLAQRNWSLIGASAACVILICIPWRYDADSFRSGPGLLLMSMKLFPTLALFVLVCGCMRFAGDSHCGTIGLEQPAGTDETGSGVKPTGNEAR